MSRSASTWIPVGAVVGFLGVAFGAFGAHGLAARASEQQLEYAANLIAEAKRQNT